MVAGHGVFRNDEFLGRCDVTLGLNTSDLTVELWVQLEDRLQPVLFSYAHTDSVFGNEILVWKRSSGKMSFNDNQLWGPVATSTANYEVADGVWHHVAVTREYSSGEDKCIFTFYKDGLILGTPIKKVGPCKGPRDGGCVVLGQDQDLQNGDSECVFSHDYYALGVENEGVPGNMTEVRLWRTARTAAEIFASFNAPRRITAEEAASEPFLVALWPLDCTYGFDDIKGGQHLGSCDPHTRAAGGNIHMASLADVAECCEDECYNGTHTCDAHATCHNTNAGFDCDCHAGWEHHGTGPSRDPPKTLFPSKDVQLNLIKLAPGKECYDINECYLDHAMCHVRTPSRVQYLLVCCPGVSVPPSKFKSYTVHRTPHTVNPTP